MRPFLTLWHRYIGLLLTPFLALTALTGILLTWNAQLERVFAPSLFQLPPSAQPAAPTLDPFALRDIALKAFPHARIDGLDLTRLPDAPRRFYLSTAPGAAPLPFDEIALDPVNGRLLGTRRNGDISQGLINAMPFVYRLHDSLALGAPGAALLGFAALLWLVDCAIAGLLTFPARADPRRTPIAWLRKWREAWGVRHRSGTWRMQFDLHRAGGLWPWPVMVLLALSGVAFNLPQVYRPVLNALVGFDSAYQRLPSVSPPAQAPALDLRAGYAAAKEALNAAAMREGFVVRSERLVYYDESKRAYVYRVNSDRDAGTRATTQIYVDADSGAVLALDAPNGSNVGRTLTDWITNLHTAKVFGWPMKVILTLTGVAILMLTMTGVTIFLRKRRTRD